MRNVIQGLSPGDWWVLGERKGGAVLGANNIGAFTTSRPGGGGRVHLHLEEQSCEERASLEELGPSPGTGFSNLGASDIGG